MAVPSFQTDFIPNCFNSFHPRPQFTMKRSGDILNFLDVTISKKENSLIFDSQTELLGDT